MNIEGNHSVQRYFFEKIILSFINNKNWNNNVIINGEIKNKSY